MFVSQRSIIHEGFDDGVVVVCDSLDADGIVVLGQAAARQVAADMNGHDGTIAVGEDRSPRSAFLGMAIMPELRPVRP